MTNPTLLTLIVDMTPDPSLNVNARDTPYAKSGHKLPIWQAAQGAMQNALVADPGLADRLNSHRLRLDFTIFWEQSRGSRRRRWDDDNLKGGPLKFVRDALCAKLERPGGDADVVTGEVEQAFPEERQGWIEVAIVSLGEIVRAEEAPVIQRCEAKTKRGTRCTRVASREVGHAGRVRVLCTSHGDVCTDGGSITFAEGDEAA